MSLSVHVLSSLDNSLQNKGYLEQVVLGGGAVAFIGNNKRTIKP